MNLSKNIKVPFLAVISLLLLTSCELLDDTSSQVPNWVVSVNEIVKYPRASMGEREVASFDGRPIWVRKNYEFNSKSIKSIETIPIDDKPGYYNLKFNLNKHGSLVAMRLCNDSTHDPWALLVNGVYYRSVEFSDAALNDDYTQIELKGPFDKTVADFLEKYSTKNYEHYHEDE